MTETQNQQPDYLQIIASMLNAIRSNGPVERMVMRHKALNAELLSLSHSIANYLRYSDFQIEPDQVNFLLSYYNPQPQEVPQVTNSQQDIEVNVGEVQIQKTELPKQQKQQEEKLAPATPSQKLSMAQARGIVLDILKKYEGIKRLKLGVIKELIDKRNLEINKHSLKAILTNMKKEGLIENDPEKGGWALLAQEQKV